MAARSFPDEYQGSLGADSQMLTMGFVIVFIYVFLMLGKFNSVEQRAYLALTGIAAIGLGIVSCHGLAGVLNIDNGPLNLILPFLLLGIGIDDMFVIVQSFSNIKVSI